MKKQIFIPLFFMLFGALPVGMALTQDVPTHSRFQLSVLLVSMAAFGLMLGMFWLSHLLRRDTVKMRFSSTLRWHKTIGYIAGTFFMVHPVLMIARRFWVDESNPVDNLMLMLRAPLLRSGLIAWLLLLLIVVTAIFRKAISGKSFRTLHGILSIAFVGFATWHVVSIGRHSNPTTSVFWIILAGVAIAALLTSYIKVLLKPAKKGAL